MPRLWAVPPKTADDNETEVLPKEVIEGSFCQIAKTFLGHTHAFVMCFK